MSLANKLAKAQFRGDYMDYKGDPGLFGDIWGGIKSVGRTATSLVSGLNIPFASGVARTAGRVLFGRGRETIPGASTFPSMFIGERMPTSPIAGPGSIPLAFAPTSRAAAPMAFASANGACPDMKGYHANTSDYFLRSGEFVGKGTRYVKNRRRNPGNMKALSRSLGRIKSAKKMAATLGQVRFVAKC